MYSNTTGTVIHLTQPGHDMIYSTGLNSPPFSFFLLFFSFLQPKGAEVCKDCPVGTYCLSGEGIQLCPAGHYCLGGGVEGILPCPPGTYSPQFGLSQVEQCLICPAGESVVICLPPRPLSQMLESLTGGYTVDVLICFVLFCFFLLSKKIISPLWRVIELCSSFKYVLLDTFMGSYTGLLCSRPTQFVI